MAIPKVFLKFLDSQKIKYEVVDHRRVFTAYDKASTLHEDPKTVVKTAVFQIGAKQRALVLVPAHKHIDKQKVKAAVNVWLRKKSLKPEKAVDFAKEAWMKKNLQGEVGMTPPFAGLLQMPAFVDNALLKVAKLYVNAGSYEHSFLVNQANFKKVLGEVFVKGAFSKS